MENQYKYSVCIRCITYNHEKYLADALEGFVMQKTTFPFVAIVHDDASTDGTVDILRQYAKKYPDIIKPIYETENQYSKHDGSIGRIMDAEMAKYNPKYIAMCEGDDYWTDPYKLQKQVDFLESHPDSVMCYHNAWQTWEDKKHIFIDSIKPESDISLKELLTVWHIPTASVLYRRDVEKDIPKLKLHPNGDYCLELRLKSRGEIHYDPAIMSVYRMHSDSMSAGMNRNKVKMYQDIIDLLLDARSLYPSPDDQLLFDNAVKKYEHLIWDIQISNHPIKKWFYRKTYTRAIKRWMGKNSSHHCDGAV